MARTSTRLDAFRHWSRWLLLIAGLSLGAPGASAAAPDSLVTGGNLDPARGAVVARPEGGHAQLVVHDAHLELWFFDAFGRRVPSSWGHGVVIYRSPAHQREIAILHPTADRLALRSVDVLDGPFAFHARISLFPPGGSKTARSYEFDFDRGAGRT